MRTRYDDALIIIQEVTDFIVNEDSWLNLAKTHNDKDLKIVIFETEFSILVENRLFDHIIENYFVCEFSLNMIEIHLRNRSNALEPYITLFDI